MNTDHTTTARASKQDDTGHIRIAPGREEKDQQWSSLQEVLGAALLTSGRFAAQGEAAQERAPASAVAASFRRSAVDAIKQT
jgi:hypothetical protein